ncbi:protein shisa-8 [Ambystoma mexicanum]|uniref:protein shisa-8 n=1 Tax=Ambystoma mexicanum TaxID=8296 RepID=UPI0037E866FF
MYQMARSHTLGVCWLLLLPPSQVWTRTPTTKRPGLEGATLEAFGGSQSPPGEDGPTERPLLADRCRGYYDVMGQWDPPFNCNAGAYLYCCGTCGYRFCCQFRHGQLDQSTCSNYDTPNWANTGQPPARKDDAADDPAKDRTNMVVYIICGLVALMVLVGIFTKLGLEKSQRPQGDITMSRTLTELLKQPGNGNSDLIPSAHRPSIQVQITEVIPHTSPRNSIDHTSQGSVGLGSPLMAPTGLGHPHNSRPQMVTGMGLPGQDYGQYATLKAVESATDEFYKRYSSVDMSAMGTPSYKTMTLRPKDGQDGCGGHSSHAGSSTPVQKNKVAKTNTHPMSGSAFQAWEPPGRHEPRRQGYANKRQYSIEKLPALFSQPSHYPTTQRQYSGNSKTEVTV